MPGQSTNNPNDYIAFGLQANKNVEASTFYFVKHGDGSGFETETEYQRVREGGDGQEVGLTYKSQIKADGALNGLMRPELGARLGVAVLGADSATVITASGIAPLVDHFITPVASIPYHTVEQRWAGEVERVSNVKFAQLEVEWEAGRAFKVSAPFMSAGTVAAGGAGLSPVRETPRPFYYPAASVVITGASGAALTKGKTTVKRGLDDGIQTNTLYREDLVEQNQDHDVDATIKYENSALWRRAHYADDAGAAGSIVSNAIATLGFSVHAAQGSNQFSLNHPLLEVVGAKVNKLDPDGKTMYLDLALQSVKGATHPTWLRVRTGATAPYTLGS